MPKRAAVDTERRVTGYLLVRANQVSYGLPIEDVVEVVDGAVPVPVPAAQSAVRGVTNLRGRMVPVVDLAALLTQTDPSEEFSSTVVLVHCKGKPVAFGVDDADAVVRELPLPVPPGRQLECALGIASHSDRLIPILDLDALGERLALEEGVAANE